MSHTPSSGFESELRASPRPVTLAMLGLALVIAVIGGLRTDVASWLLTIAVLLLVGPAALWLVGDRWPILSRWLLALIPATIALLAIFLGAPAVLLVLCAISIALLATLVGLRGSLGACVVVSAVLLLLLPFSALAGPAGELWPIIAVSLLVSWSIFGAFCAAYAPIRQLARWSWEFYDHARAWLDEAQAHRGQLEQALDDLVHANRQISLANDRMSVLRQLAEDERRAKEVFVARVSHEFRTPLNVIIGMVSLMVDNPRLYGEFPARAMEHLETVYRTCKHLASMIDDVLDLSQADSGRVTIRRERVPLRDILDTSLSVVRPLLDRKGLALHLELADDLPEIDCDRVRIRQVILNLLSNAARFTDDGGITVTACQQGANVLIDVADSGPGIAAEDMDHLFQPFVQGGNDPLRTRGGSGLGLSISKQFVELHGGRIWLESEPGKGTVFHVQLPVAAPPPPAANAARWMVEDWSWYEGRTGPGLKDDQYRPRVVVYDETGELRHALDRRTQEVEVVDAGSLSAAIEQAAAVPAHALMVNTATEDALWPAVRQAQDALSDTPILGSICPTRLGYALANGVMAYLTKPLNHAGLVEALAKLGHSIGTALVVDDDPDARALMTMALKAIDERIQVSTAADGEAALAAMRLSPPDVVLLDVIMPGLSGWDVVAARQADDTLRALPVIMVSAQDIGEGPVASPLLLATMHGGVSVSQILRAGLALSQVLLTSGEAGVSAIL